MSTPRRPPGQSGQTRLLVVLAAATVMLGIGGPAGSGEVSDDSRDARVVQVPDPDDAPVSLVLTPPRALSLVDLDAGDITVREGSRSIPAKVAPLAGGELDVMVVMEVDAPSPAAGAADELLRTLPADARVGLVAVAEDPVVVVPLTDDRARVLDAVSKAEARSGGDLVDAVGDAVEQLGSGTGRRPTIVAISADLDVDADALRTAVGGSSLRPALYLAATGDPSAALDQATVPTGGRAVVVDRTSLLIAATDEVSADLGAQYRLDLDLAADDTAELTVRVAKDAVETETAITLTGSAPDGSPPLGRGDEEGFSAPGDAPTAPTRPDTGILPFPLAFWVLAALVGALVAAVAIGLGRRRPTQPSPVSGSPTDEPGPAPPPITDLEGASSAVPAEAPPGPALRPAEAVIDLRDPRPAEAVIDLRDPRPAFTGKDRELDLDLDLHRALDRDRELDLDLVAAARRADDELEALDAVMRTLPDDFPLDALVLREAVASVNLQEGGITLGDVLLERIRRSHPSNASAVEVERRARALVRGFAQAAEGRLDGGVLTEIVGRGAPRARSRMIEHPAGLSGPASAQRRRRWERPGSALTSTVARSVRLVGAPVGSPVATGPALRAAMTRQEVERTWSDQRSRPWIGSAALSLSLARDGALRWPVIDVSGGSGPASTGHDPLDRARASARETVDALETCSARTRRRLEELLGLHETYVAQIARTRDAERGRAAINVLLSSPVVTTQSMAEAADLSSQSAFHLLCHFRQKGWVRRTPLTDVRGQASWLAPDVVAILGADLANSHPVSSLESKEHL